MDRHRLGAHELRTPEPNDPPWRSLVVTAALAGLIWLLYATAVNESTKQLHARGGFVLLATMVAAVAGSYLLLLAVLVTARPFLVERVIPGDQLASWHRLTATAGLALISAHAVLVVVGISEATHDSMLGWTGDVDVVTLHSPDVFSAVTGLALLLMLAASSAGPVFRRIRRSTWWSLHLLVYLALALSFAHTLRGGTFAGHPITEAVWWAMWIGTASAVIVFRVARPIARTLRHRLTVKRVITESPGVTSLVLEGNRVEDLGAVGGQFFQWRFWTWHLWWHAHPYSLSALPSGRYLRLTVKDLGRASSRIAKIKVGTKVGIEGPYGNFTAERLGSRRRVVLVAGGIGITPLRAILEALPAKVPITVVVRASRESDVLFERELVALLDPHPASQLHIVVGHRRQVRFTPADIALMVPDMAASEVFICGPTAWMNMVGRTVATMGTPADRVHQESFG
jgi:ferredoxin-NADP reductase/DMSO/TMAO reductase YedYZ heme-binding membrane subunit